MKTSGVEMASSGNENQKFDQWKLFGLRFRFLIIQFNLIEVNV